MNGGKPEIKIKLSVFRAIDHPANIGEEKPGDESLVIKLQSPASYGENPFNIMSPQFLLFEAFRPSNRDNHKLYQEAISRCLFSTMKCYRG